MIHIFINPKKNAYSKISGKACLRRALLSELCFDQVKREDIRALSFKHI